MNLKTFTEEMAKIQMAFGKIEKEKFNFYFEIIGSKISNEQMRLATKNLCTEFIPTAANQFPAPAHIIFAAGLSRKSVAQELIDALRKTIRRVGGYKSVDFGSSELHSVVQRFGGWDSICQWGQDAWDINEGRFREALETAIICGDSGPVYLPGICETDNGFLNPRDFVQIKKENGVLMFAGNKKSPLVTRPGG